MSANTYGRQVTLPLTNKSGGGVIAGDVVIIDTTNNEAFTTTTSASFTGTVGIAQETIANNAVGRVLTEGYAALVNVNASVTRGHYGATFTVAKQATDAGATRSAGCFVQFLTGGTTPSGQVYPVDLAGATGNVATDNIWAAAGDLAVGTGVHTAHVLTAGTAGEFLVSGGAADPVWTPALVGGQINYAKGSDYTTTSTSIVSLDSTNLKFTKTTGAHSVLLIAMLNAWNDTAGQAVYFDFLIDGAQVGAQYSQQGATGTAHQELVMSIFTTTLTPGSHTFEIGWLVAANTGHVASVSGSWTVRFGMAEQPW